MDYLIPSLKISVQSINQQLFSSSEQEVWSYETLTNNISGVKTHSPFCHLRYGLNKSAENINHATIIIKLGAWLSIEGYDNAIRLLDYLF